ncbi:MAG: ABC transporter substrate-binding protein [Gammaproteobacteria bacterium]|nr:MAG: ABC transporter substrate-binding protein [Gammaproteobacteria bacterium]
MTYAKLHAAWIAVARIFSIVKVKKSLSLLALGLVTLVSAGGAGEPIRVASKIDTEGGLLGNIVLQMLESRGLPVENKVSMASSNIVRDALLSGEIDIYPEYTGNGAFFSQTPKDAVWKDLQKGYAAIKAFDDKTNHLVWLAPAPANNTWAIAVTGKLAADEQLKTLHDFARYVNAGGTVKLAGSAEFIENPLALPSFQNSYGFMLGKEQVLVLSGGNTAATIQAAAAGINGCNAAMVYGTDGAIAAAGLVVLDDPKGAQAVYAPAPVVRAETLQAYPQIATILAPVFASLERETLQKLNEQIQVKGIPAGKVARTYLTEKGFIKP